VTHNLLLQGVGPGIFFRATVVIQKMTAAREEKYVATDQLDQCGPIGGSLARSGPRQLVTVHEILC